MFRVQMLPAQRGDALLVTYGDPNAPHNLLIDGGPYGDYQDSSPEELAWKAQVNAWQNSGLELLVISHIDADHIEGVVQLLRQESLPSIAEVWFNGWQHLGDTDTLGSVEGEILTTLIEEREMNWNGRFDQRAIAYTPGQPLPSVELPGGMRLTLVAPDPRSLIALRPTWQKEVLRAGLVPGKPVPHKEWPSDLLGEKEVDVEAEARKRMSVDRSKANGSSIVFLAEAEGKACLFGADARPPVLEAGLKALLQERGEKVLKVDAFKVPHHGSKRNLSPATLRMLDSRRYLISTNGSRFRHPDREAMARILKRSAEQEGEAPSVCFNYRNDFTSLWDEDELKENYHYQTVYPADGEAGLGVDL